MNNNFFLIEEYKLNENNFLIKKLKMSSIIIFNNELTNQKTVFDLATGKPAYSFNKQTRHVNFPSVSDERDEPIIRLAYNLNNDNTSIVHVLYDREGRNYYLSDYVVNTISANSIAQTKFTEENNMLKNV